MKGLAKASTQRFLPYPFYKDSGMEWLGEIPAHWDLRRLKTIVSVNDESLPEDTEPKKEILYVDISNVDSVDGILSKEEMTFDHAPSRARRLVLDGDVIISTVRTYLRAIAEIRDPEANLIVSTGFAVLRPRRGIDGRFGAYALRAPYFVDQVVAESVGVSFPAINASEIGCFPIALPPQQEQHAITAFLDRETAKIDALVAKKKRLIELLQDSRAVLIAQAVTKGLNPRVPMKDSEVEWLGEIPAHWAAIRIKLIARLESGHTPSRQHPEYWENCTIPWFGLADVWQIRDGRKEYVTETNEKISELGLVHSAARLLPKDTVILSRTASVGFSAIMAKDMATTQDFVNWVCGPKLRPEYLLYVFRSMREEFKRLTMGSTHQTIYMPDVGRLTTPLPRLEEQDQIVAFVRQGAKRIDALIDKTEEAIGRLKELRTTLISAAVTGKIDLREEAQ